LKSKDDLIEQFVKIRDVIAFYALDVRESHFEMLARGCYLELAAERKTESEISELIVKLLNGPISVFVLNLISAIVQKKGFSDAKLMETFVKLAIENVKFPDRRGISFSILATLVMKFKMELANETLQQLFTFDDNIEFILKLINEKIIPDDTLESILKTLAYWHRSTVIFVQAYIQTQNNFPEGLQSLPFVGEDLLWDFIRISNSHRDFHTLLVDSYCTCHTLFISSELMIEIFTNRWYQEFQTGPRRELILFLDRFVTAIDVSLDPDIFDCVPHKVDNTRITIFLPHVQPGMALSKRKSVKVVAILVEMAAAAALPTNAFLLRGNQGIVPFEGRICDHSSPDKFERYVFDLIEVPAGVPRSTY
jgi:hypothetical protein